MGNWEKQNLYPPKIGEEGRNGLIQPFASGYDKINHSRHLNIPTELIKNCPSERKKTILATLDGLPLISLILIIIHRRKSLTVGRSGRLFLTQMTYQRSVCPPYTRHQHRRWSLTWTSVCPQQACWQASKCPTAQPLHSASAWRFVKFWFDSF